MVITLSPELEAALTELAQVRNVPLGALMEQLGIKAPAHD